ncbi:hypothetical protein T07_624 [Trichinella nelsoni]|uniref:Uncharacterized protein n=1 Tax=Trichinella nelsoni TaxID=6336 RepID=A0A0V0SJE7_9BILA|nr:hypothetical protein T07_624 [Trichinella nelsoni]
MLVELGDDYVSHSNICQALRVSARLALDVIGSFTLCVHLLVPVLRLYSFSSSDRSPTLDFPDGDSQNWDEHKFRYGLESSVSNRRSAGAGVFHPYNLPRNFYPFFVFHTLDCGHIYGPDLFVVEERCCIYDVTRRFETVVDPLNNLIRNLLTGNFILVALHYSNDYNVDCDVRNDARGGEKKL